MNLKANQIWRFVYVNLQGRRWLFLTCGGLRLLVLAINFLIPSGINFREVKAVEHVTLFGEAVGYPLAVPNPWMLLAQLSHLMLLIFCATRNSHMKSFLSAYTRRIAGFSLRQFKN